LFDLAIIKAINEKAYRENKRKTFLISYSYRDENIGGIYEVEVAGKNKKHAVDRLSFGDSRFLVDVIKVENVVAV
jgi:hypothetical protein